MFISLLDDNTEYSVSFFAHPTVNCTISCPNFTNYSITERESQTTRLIITKNHPPRVMNDSTVHLTLIY